MAIAESMMDNPDLAEEIPEAPAIRWQPLGDGRQAPAGSLRDPGLAALLAGYKEDVARRYQSMPPDRIEESLPPGRIINSRRSTARRGSCTRTGAAQDCFRQPDASSSALV